MEGPYADLILDSSDVCSNCFSLVSVERVDPVIDDSGLGRDLDAHLSRRTQTTTREYHDSDPEPTQCKVTFCRCGVEGSHTRIWDPTDVGEAVFKPLLKQVLKTLGEKGIELDRPRKKETMTYALMAFAETEDVDKAMSVGIEAGITAQAASANASESRNPRGSSGDTGDTGDI